MKNCKHSELEMIVGGTNVTGSLINSFSSFIKTIMEVGSQVGSALRRISEGNMCPLE